MARYLLTDVDGRPATADAPFGLSISRKLDGSTEVVETTITIGTVDRCTGNEMWVVFVKE